MLRMGRDVRRQRAGRKLAKDPLPAPPFDAKITRKREAEVNDLLVEKRHPNLEAREHASSVDLEQVVVRQHEAKVDLGSMCGETFDGVPVPRRSSGRGSLEQTANGLEISCVHEQVPLARPLAANRTSSA